ncbi:hypothetical protein QFC22_001371 [Naganishia vaughanmartiniae]|uniref:Uncharacterized protein n=1 Tax=Naganishia vaughanmartiniae TaxID=1424756 RepID=A0ACC2XH66_9TREE|nr:hypothetical protein QFC22_001371 [Naganishia vaughanmartiniae]
MDAFRVFDFAVGLVEISLLSWCLIACHYKLRPSSFDLIFKRRDRMQEWRAEMYDLPKTVVYITSPFLSLGHIGMGIVDMVMFLPLMIAFVLLHVIAATSIWVLMPFILRPGRFTLTCVRNIFSAPQVFQPRVAQGLSMSCAYGNARRSDLQSALTKYANLERLAAIRQHRAKRACVFKQSLRDAVAPEVAFIRSAILLLQDYARLGMWKLKRGFNQLMTPERAALAQEWRKLAEAEVKRSLREYLNPEIGCKLARAFDGVTAAKATSE